MPRVVIDRKNEKVAEAAASCPVNCFKKNDNEFVIDCNCCIDCGVCQTIVDDGIIIEDSEANQSDIDFNNEKALEWESAQ